MKKIRTLTNMELLLILIALVVAYAIMVKSFSNKTVTIDNAEEQVETIEEANEISGLNLRNIESLGNVIKIKAYKGTEHIVTDEAELIAVKTDGKLLDYFSGVDSKEEKIENTSRFTDITYKKSKSTIDEKEEDVELINFRDTKNGYVLILIGNKSNEEIRDIISEIN